MEKNYKLISVFFIISFLILTTLSCSIANSGKTGSVSNNGQSVSDETISSFSLTEALNTLKEKLVNPPVITSHKPYQELTSNNNKELVIIKGKSDIDTSIALKVNGILSEKKYAVDSSGDFEIKDGIEIVEGTNTVEIYAVNADGEKSEPTKLTFLLNIQKNLDFTVYENAENLVEIFSQFYSKEFKPLVYVHGIALPAVDVYLKVNDKIIGNVQSSDTGAFFFENVGLSHGGNIISVWYVSGNGQPSVQINKEITVFKDVVSPNPSSLTGYVSSNGNHLGWAQSSDAGFVSYKIVRVEDPAKNPHYPDDNVIATIADRTISSYTDTDIISGKAYFYTLWTLDNAGNLISSNVLPLPAPKYTISMIKLPSLQGNVLARREWYYEYFEITNTGNVPVNIQPILVWFLLDPDSDPEMALNPLWAVYIWDPSTGTYYYSNEDIRESHVSDWIGHGSTQKYETVTYSADGLSKTTTVLEVYKIAEETVGKRIVSFDRTTTITVEDLVTGVSTTTTAHEVSKGIAEPEKVGNIIEGIQPGDKIKLAVKIANVAADNGDKIVVHFNFAPTDSFGYYFTDDIVSTYDIFITSSGK
ncbi:MAG: fibronectin type III domain-containing protein [Candidatus Humimicrobiaceae bacterium]